MSSFVKSLFALQLLSLQLAFLANFSAAEKTADVEAIANTENVREIKLNSEKDSSSSLRRLHGYKTEVVVNKTNAVVHSHGGRVHSHAYPNDFAYKGLYGLPYNYDGFDGELIRNYHGKQWYRYYQNHAHGDYFTVDSFRWPQYDPFFASKMGVCARPLDFGYQAIVDRKYCVESISYDGCRRVLPVHHWFQRQDESTCCWDTDFVGCSACQNRMSVFQYCRLNPNRGACPKVFKELYKNGCGEIVSPFWDHIH